MTDRASPEPAKPRKKLWVRIAVPVAVIVFILAAAAGIYAWRFTSVTRNITVGAADLNQLQDGTYRGSFSVFHVKAEVQVRIRDHAIEEVRTLKTPEGAGNLDALLERIVAQQTPAVDIESGASVSQKAVLKATEDALTP